MAIIQGEKKFVQQQEKYSLAKKKEFEIDIKKNMIKSLESKTTTIAGEKSMTKRNHRELF